MAADRPYYADPERPRSVLLTERAKLPVASSPRDAQEIRSSVRYWSRVTTLSVMKLRAEAGDRAAARRLAWRELVTDAREQNRWLVTRAQALDNEIRRLARAAAPDCGHCAPRLARARASRDEFVAEIAALPGTVPTYSEFCIEARAKTDDAHVWLRRQLDQLEAGA